MNNSISPKAKLKEEKRVYCLTKLELPCMKLQISKRDAGTAGHSCTAKKAVTTRSNFILIEDKQKNTDPFVLQKTTQNVAKIEVKPVRAWVL